MGSAMRPLLPIISGIAISAYAGNMLNIGASHALYWLSLEPIAFMHFFAIDFPLLLIPTAATVLPAWLGSLYVFLKSDGHSESRTYWRLAFWGVTLTIVQTAVYHLPINLDFMALAYDAPTASDKLNGWIASHWIRVVLAVISAFFALKGIQHSTSNHPNHGQLYHH